MVTMKEGNGTLTSLPSPVRLFFTVLVIVSIAEVAAMILLQVLFPNVHNIARVLADASIMIVLSAPFLWWAVVRPLRSTVVAEHVRAATVVAAAADGIITLNGQGLVESFNPAAERIFGYEKNGVVGNPVTLLMAERDRGTYQEGLERVRSSGESRIIGKTIGMHGLKKDGREFPLELSLTAWKVGPETFYTGIVRDITERYQAEEALKESQRFLQSTLDALSTRIAILDQSGSIVAVNAAWRRFAEAHPLVGAA